MNPAIVVAEIGCIHLGSFDRAKELIRLAKICDADYVKFQKRNPEESVPEYLKNKLHPNQDFAYGDTYLEHRENLEFTIDEHLDLFNYCNIIGIKYSCSVWDMTSAKEIISLKPDYIKIPSACNNNKNMIKFLLDNYEGDIHISTGMTSEKELKELVNFVSSSASRIILYHCTSIYPCPFEKLYLLDLDIFSVLKAKYGFGVGFSNHGFGISADIAAWVLGAEWIERHFVDDRTIKHTDAAASLEPEGLRKLCRDLKNVNKAMKNSPAILDELEIAERKKLRIEWNGN